MFGLSLADGTSWGIAAADREAEEAVQCLRRMMQLEPCDASTLHVFVHGAHGWDEDASDGGCADCDIQFGKSHARGEVPQSVSRFRASAFQDGESLACHLAAISEMSLWEQLCWLLTTIALRHQCRGALLLHGALVARDAAGVILCGPGRAGNLPQSRGPCSPWQLSSEDVSLVVCGKEGRYRAHPWPTWSRARLDEQDYVCASGESVALEGIYFLHHAQEQRMVHVGKAEAAGLLLQAAEKAARPVLHQLDRPIGRSLRLECLQNAAMLVTEVPIFRLYLPEDSDLADLIDESWPQHYASWISAQ
jgi:SynChlorMet cassette protein ScmC